jgi:thioredoxin-related protein
MTHSRRIFCLVAVAIAVAPAMAQEPKAPVWLPFEEALATGERSDKMVVIDIWSPNCGWCRKMQAEVYPREDLLKYLNDNFVTGRLNIDIQDDSLSYQGYTLSSAELAVGLGAQGTPTTVFLAPDGSYITRLPGFHDYDSYIRVLKFIGSESFRDMSFDEYLEKTGEANTAADN